MTVGKKIRAIRKSLKQTQKQLAKASGIGLNSIIRYEKGLRDPTISQLQRIAQGLGVPLVELLPEKDYGKTWLAYAYPPAHIDREAWEPCEYCNGKINLYQHTHTTKLFMNTFREAATLVTECNGCPPYADCCMKGISMNSAFRISYCPECGRPLTDEAVDMVMERLEALYGKTD